MRIPRQLSAYPLVLFGALVLTFEDLLRTDTVPAYRDLLPFVIPFKHYLAERLRAGEIPLWNPWISMGTPFLASLQTGVFYPPTLTLLLPFPLGFNLFLFSHFVIALAGFWCLSRDRGLSAAASAIGCLTFTLGGYLVSMLNVTNHLQAAVWSPWVLFFWKRTTERPARSSMAAFLLCVAAELLGGAPEVLLMTLCVLGAWTAIVPERSSTERLRLEATLGALVAVALGATAFQILPTWEYIHESARVGALAREEVMNWSMKPISLVQLLFPHSASKPAVSARLILESAEPWIRSIYLGLVPLCLAAGGLSSRADRRLWGSTILVATLLALGPATPILPLLYQTAPAVFGKFRYPEKFYFLVHFAAAMLAASGAEALFRRDRHASLLVLACAAALAAIAASLCVARWVWPAAYLQGVSHMTEYAASPTQYVPLALDLVSKGLRACVLLGCFLAIVALWRGAVLGLPIASALVVGLVVADLVSINHGLDHPVPWSSLRAQSPAVDLEWLRESRRRIFDYETGAVPGQPPLAILGMRQMERLAVHPTAADDSHVAWRVLRMNIPMIEHVGTLSGIDGIFRRSDDILNGISEVVTRDRSVKLLRTFGAAYLIGQTALEMPGLEQTATFGDPPVFVYRTADPAPAVYLASRLHAAAATADAFNQMIKPEFVPGVDATVDEIPESWREKGADSAEARAPGSIRVIDWRAERVELQVDADRPSLLVLNDSFFPGWQAAVDGNPAEIHRANDLVRGIFVGDGRHHVVFAYRPRPFFLGVVLSIVAMLAAVPLTGWLSRPSRSAPDQSGAAHVSPAV